MQVRSIAWMTDPKTAWAITGLPYNDAVGDLTSFEYPAAEFGIKYEDISKTNFAAVLMNMYDFAYLGRQDMSKEKMEDESSYAWITPLLVDLNSGAMGQVWNTYEAEFCRSAAKCVAVAELANARVVLEGGESFFSSFQSGQRSDQDDTSGGLSIRQMALLAGMEEMSVRAAANPKRPSPLITRTTRFGTSVDLAVAKEWLISKGRYVPITKVWGDADIDLTKQRFDNPLELMRVLDARYESVRTKSVNGELESAMHAMGITVSQGLSGAFLEYDISKIKDEAFLLGLANVFSLPADLLVLRVQEMLAANELARVTKRIRGLIEQPNNANTTP